MRCYAEGEADGGDRCRGYPQADQQSRPADAVPGEGTEEGSGKDGGNEYVTTQETGAGM